jgi:HSP20 family protein
LPLDIARRRGTIAVPGFRRRVVVPWLLRRGSSEVEPREDSDRLDRLSDEWTHLLPFRMLEPLGLPAIFEHDSLIRVDEYRDGDDLVVRAEIPGVDVEKDVEITVSDHRLHIEAERHQEEKAEGKCYVRRELRYGRLARDLQLPESVAESDVSARYVDGILEVRVHMPPGTPPARIPIESA